jgi:hypothetical protein
MLLILVAALSLALFVEHQLRIAAERRAHAEAARARMRALEAYAVAERTAAELRWATEKAKESGPRRE